MGIQDMSVANQIQQLEAVQAATALQEKKTAAARQRRMVLAANRRLAKWAEWTDRAERGDTAFISSMTGAITGCGEGGSGGDVSGMPDDIYDTDRAVRGLAEKLQAVVRMEYFYTDLLQYQRAERLGVGRATYENRLREARQNVFYSLYAPGGKACGKVAGRVCVKTC